MTRGQAYRESNWSAQFGFVIIIVVIIVIAVLVNRAGRSPNRATPALSPSTAVPASATLDRLSGKATIEAIGRATPAAAATLTTPGSLAMPTQDTRPTPTANFPEATPAGAGVIVFHPAVPGNWGRVAINMWVELPTGLVVFAGGTDDPAQGAVFVLLPTERIDSPEAYLTPVKAGLVEVSDAVGERLVLKTISGDDTFYFDVPTRQFVDSFTATSAAPTVTPPPSATPIVLIRLSPAPYPAGH
jgi:hypothetical protein